MRDGFVVWFTGLSGTGKSTLSQLLSEELRARDVHSAVLDGDQVRIHLSKELGFSRADRDVNVRRIGFVAKLLAEAGACAITATISPYRAVRDEQRRANPRFCEVYCYCSMAVLAARDPKGLYKRALSGDLKNFTGIDDPYEAPLVPDVLLDTGHESQATCVAKIMAALVRMGYVADSAPRIVAPLPQRVAVTG